ncbi:MAG TPA: hypothetical protein VKC59_00060 [Candidatus Limnocylindrales bacterium]|nr:hypothetical protein [Candidatus Limnocylindrales bacterium]
MPLDRSRSASIPTMPRLDALIDVPGGRLKIIELLAPLPRWS